MSKISKTFGVVAFIVAFVVWGILFTRFKDCELVVFPSGGYEVYTLTDAVAGGFSTSELSVNDSLISASVNVRSGKAFPFAGAGINLMSMNNRPTGFFDMTRFDSVAVVVTAGRMKSVSFRILTDDPVYSKQGMYLSYRPLEHSVPVTKSFAEVKISVSDFKTAEWWLAGQGLEEDDGLTFLHRTTLFEIYNGEGALRGIPDEIEVKEIRLWGVNRNFLKGMYFAAGLLILLFGGFICLSVRSPKQNPPAKRGKYV